MKRRNEGAEARERGRSIEGILIPILLFLPHSSRIEQAFMMGYRFMAQLRRYYACIGRSRGRKKGEVRYDFRYLDGTERERRRRRRKTREGGALEHCEDNEAKARFLPFQLAPPNDISND